MDWLYRSVGCEFVLAARPDKVEAVETYMKNEGPLTVATSYPGWFGDIAIRRFWGRSTICLISGLVEVFGNMEAYDAVADLRCSGETLRANALQEVFRLAGVGLGLIYDKNERELSSNDI